MSIMFSKIYRPKLSSMNAKFGKDTANGIIKQL